MPMTARLTNLTGTPLVEIWGDIDHGTCGALDKALDEAWDEGASVILLDLGSVSYIDSGGLSVIFSHARRLSEGGWLGLIGVNDNIRRLLEIVGVLADPRFRLFRDRDEAGAGATGDGTP
jgi:anti-anti-sigma factor